MYIIIARARGLNAEEDEVAFSVKLHNYGVLISCWTFFFLLFIPLPYRRVLGKNHGSIIIINTQLGWYVCCWRSQEEKAQPVRKFTTCWEKGVHVNVR